MVKQVGLSLILLPSDQIEEIYKQCCNSVPRYSAQFVGKGKYTFETVACKKNPNFPLLKS